MCVRLGLHVIFRGRACYTRYTRNCCGVSTFARYTRYADFWRRHIITAIDGLSWPVSGRRGRHGNISAYYFAVMLRHPFHAGRLWADNDRPP